jgi:hypothetical protein
MIGVYAMYEYGCHNAVGWILGLGEEQSRQLFAKYSGVLIMKKASCL